TSDWSPVWTFTYVHAPTPGFSGLGLTMLSPGNGARVHVRPTFTANSIQSSGGVMLTYRFEVSASDSSLLAVSPEIPEAPTQTSWQLAADLPIGIPLTWRVIATATTT